MSQSYHQNNAEQLILSGTQPFICQLSSKKSRKPTAEDGSLFTTTMRALNTSVQTTAFLSPQNIDLMSHPPYSPDLPTNGFFLFPYVKNIMKGQRFFAPEEAVAEFRMHVLRIPQSERQKCFDNWFKRMQKCLGLNGRIFGKTIKLFSMINICFCSLILKYKRQPSYMTS